MSDHDQTQDFLNNLPELEPGKTFGFACHPGVRCFNACCGDLNLMLTPYDVLRLRKGLGHDSKKFIHNHAEITRTPSVGFPMCKLRMLDNAKRSCPFVRDEGCSIYENRPGACRTYPLGRASRMSEEGETLSSFSSCRNPTVVDLKKTRLGPVMNGLKIRVLNRTMKSTTATCAS